MLEPVQKEDSLRSIFKLSFYLNRFGHINTFFSQLVRFSTICSNTSGFAERVHIIYQKLLKWNYDKKKLEKNF